jgi:hypothetical protein
MSRKQALLILAKYQMLRRRFARQLYKTHGEMVSGVWYEDAADAMAAQECGGYEFLNQIENG